MKTILLILTTLLSLTGRAQSFHLDTASKRSYVSIRPLDMPFFSSEAQVSRIYIRINEYVPRYSVTFGWSLAFPNVIDENTTNWVDLISGNMTIPITQNTTLDSATYLLFQIVAGRATWNNQPIDVRITE